MTEKDDKSFLMMRRRWVATIALFWLIALSAIELSPLREALRERLTAPADFHVREWLGRGPTLDPRLKIYSVDDKAFAHMNGWVMSISEWASLLAGIAAQQPAAIVIDQIFGKVIDPENRHVEAVMAIEALDVPIYVGSFATSVRLPRPTLRREKRYSLAAMFGSDRRQWPRRSPAYGAHVYGPHLSYHQAFEIGHISYDGSGKQSAFIEYSPGFAVPHMDLMVGGVKAENGDLFVNGHLLPLDEHGQFQVNIGGMRRYSQINKSLISLTRRLDAGKPLDRIKRGDVVLIIPLHYTGNTDFKPTPLGIFPGGYLNAAVLNSTLTGQWIRTISHTELLVAIAVVIGAVVGANMPSFVFWFLFVLGMIMAVGGSILAFAVYSISIPWFGFSFGFGASALSVFIERMRRANQNARLMRHNFQGLMGEDQIRHLEQNPIVADLDARERTVTILFVDVVGFSLVAEGLTPRLAFEHLKDMLGWVSDAITSQGGIVDRTLGDGLLAYFGYQIDRDFSVPDHAERALQCAIAIQRENVRRNLISASRHEPVLPLRIGINTSSCFVGNLGTGDRIDLTIIGNGVNFAKRLEGACDIHGVMLGKTTRDLVKTLTLPEGSIQRRFIQIKHHAELVETYEFDPLHEDPELRWQALIAFRRYANIERSDYRWPVRNPERFILTTEYGAASLINFSLSGLSLRIGQNLGRGTQLRLKLDAELRDGGRLRSRLRAENVSDLNVEVRWAYAEGEGYVHGVSFSDLSNDQRSAIVKILSDIVFEEQLSAS